MVPFTRFVIVSDVSVEATAYPLWKLSDDQKTAYLSTSAYPSPPSGAVHVRVTCLSPTTACKFVGARNANGTVVVGIVVVPSVPVVVVVGIVVAADVLVVVVVSFVDSKFVSIKYELPYQASGLLQQTPARNRYVPVPTLIDI